MGAPFRIRQSPRPPLQGAQLPASGPAPDGVAAYADRLQKLIPAGVVSLYLSGRAVIGDPADSPRLTVVWSLVCLAGVVAIRVWGTRDPATTPQIQWPAVAIAALSFVIWVYQLGGGPFALTSLYDPKAAALMLFAWTFFAPLLYRGDQTP